MSAGIPSGTPVIVHLGTPREQVFGLVLDLQPSGLLVRAVSMGSVDDWMREVRGEGAEGISPCSTFYPMHRVEKIVLDEPSHGCPAVHEQFRERVGQDLIEWFRERFPNEIEQAPE